MELDQLKSAWKIEWSELSIGTLLGSGAYGQVFKARWSGNDVAVKRMVRSADGLRDVINASSGAFEAEAEVMVALRQVAI